MNTVEHVRGMADQTSRSKDVGSSASPVQAPAKAEAEGDIPAAQGSGKVQGQISERELGSVVESLNAVAQAVRRRLEFSVDQDSGRTVIKIMDFDTQEVIRQIPPEELLRLSQHLHDAQDLHDGQGLIIDAEA